ncbi:MAG: TlpA disulfide reductase family protein [Acidobacteriota bacterium]
MKQSSSQRMSGATVLAGVFGLIAFALLLGCNATTASTDDASAAAAPAPGAPDPEAPETADFRLPDLEGNEVGPPDFLGKVVVAEFWATWCAPCRVQAKMLETLYHVVDPEAVQFLAINVGEAAETIQPYLDETPFPYPVLLDQQDELMAEYRLIGLPTILVIDPEGKITYSHVGLVDSGTLRLELIKAGMPAEPVQAAAG